MDYITIKEASALWGIDPSNIGKLCRKGKLTGAKLMGRSWFIPKNTPKPIDGRTKKARENVPVFRFPLFVNFPEDSFVPPLSSEELALRQAQADFYICEFQKSKTAFEALADNAENIYVKICAQFFMCVLAAEYDANISWEKYYCGMILSLSTDFPFKKDMELFPAWLDYILGQFGRIPEKLNCDNGYEFHPTALYMNVFLSAFNYNGKDSEKINTKCTEPFVTLCRLMERDGYYIEAQELHMVLFIYNFTALNNEAYYYHLRKAVRIAYEHDLTAFIADAETYCADAVNEVLREYPNPFAERIRTASKTIYENFSRFSEKNQNISVYSRLSKNDYPYIFYSIKGYTNRQVAEICGVSERTVANKYNDIYSKLGINGKQELLKEMGIAFGENVE